MAIKCREHTWKAIAIRDIQKICFDLKSWRWAPTSPKPRFWTCCRLPYCRRYFGVVYKHLAWVSQCGSTTSYITTGSLVSNQPLECNRVDKVIGLVSSLHMLSVHTSNAKSKLVHWAHLSSEINVQFWSELFWNGFEFNDWTCNKHLWYNSLNCTSTYKEASVFHYLLLSAWRLPTNTLEN